MIPTCAAFYQMELKHRDKKLGCVSLEALEKRRERLGDDESGSPDY
jgi:hypothetical protein